MHSSLGAKHGLSTWDDCKSEQRNADDILSRRFSPNEDNERQMGELVLANSFLGNPFGGICPWKNWFSDVVLGPYNRHQPENIHVDKEFRGQGIGTRLLLSCVEGAFCSEGSPARTHQHFASVTRNSWNS